MKSVLSCTAVAIAVLLCNSPAQADQYQIVDHQVSYDQTNHLRRVDLTIQVGNNPINRFMAHRVVKAGSGPLHLPLPTEGPVILLPSGGSTFEVYGVGGEGASLRDSLALQGFDVYGYSPRTRLLAAGYCDTHDCSPMQNWGMDTYLDDIQIITGVATLANLGKKPVVGGLSLGALLGIAAVNRNPHAYAGALIWEGTLYQSDPAARQIFSGVCDTYTGYVQAGYYYDDQTNPVTQAMAILGLTDPNGASPIIPGFTNEQCMYYVTTTPADPPDGEAPGYTYAAGSMAGWTFARPDLVIQVASQLVTYDPLALVRDYKCAYSGDRTFTDNLQAFHGKVLSIQSGHGFGAANEGTLQFMTQATITRQVNADYGHTDWLAGSDFAATNQLIGAWLTGVWP